MEILGPFISKKIIGYQLNEYYGTSKTVFECEILFKDGSKETRYYLDHEGFRRAGWYGYKNCPRIDIVQKWE